MTCRRGCCGSASSTAASMASHDSDVVRCTGWSAEPENGMSHPATRAEPPSVMRSVTPSWANSYMPLRTSTTTSIGIGSESKE